MKNKNLIVYFPGYTGMPKSIVNPLLRRFRRDGFETYSVKYNLFGRGDISELAKKARGQIQKNTDYPFYDTMTFIGHSMGGLVARKTACDGGPTPDYLVTLGSPHRGTQAAISPFWWIGGHSVGQMKPGSKFLEFCGVPDVPTLTVSGKWDLLVKDGTINFGTMLETDRRAPSNNLVVPTTHLGLITGFRTYGEVYAWLVYKQMNKLAPTFSVTSDMITAEKITKGVVTADEARKWLS